MAQNVKDLESLLTHTPDAVRPKLEAELREAKAEVEQAAAMETVYAGREGDLAAQLQAAQNEIAGSRARIAEMERALDAAIQQMIRK